MHTRKAKDMSPLYLRAEILANSGDVRLIQAFKEKFALRAEQNALGYVFSIYHIAHLDTPESRDIVKETLKIFRTTNRDSCSSIYQHYTFS